MHRSNLAQKCHAVNKESVDFRYFFLGIDFLNAETSSQ